MFNAQPILTPANLERSRVGFQGVQEDLPAQHADEKAGRSDENSGDEIPRIRAGDLGDDFTGIFAAEHPPDEEGTDGETSNGLPVHPQLGGTDVLL